MIDRMTQFVAFLPVNLKVSGSMPLLRANLVLASYDLSSVPCLVVFLSLTMIKHYMIIINFF